MSLHLAGIGGLVLVFLIGTLRPINLGAVALGMTLLFGTLAAGGAPRDLAAGFPVDLLCCSRA